jgi:hypothetical protein
VNRIPVKFNFYPADPSTKSQVKKDGDYFYHIEKDSDSGKKGRYLAGVSSGSGVDAHGDRLLPEAIEDFHKQAQEKDIPLYANHDRTFTDDIGVLSKSEVLENGDWYTEYRLHENNPEADKAWRQANGIEPYSRKREFGFSIEGFIPEDAIQQTSTGRAIRKVDIDPGVSLVTKPAYTVSHATALTKALGALVKKSLKDMMAIHEDERDNFEKKWDVQCAFDELIQLVLHSKQTDEEKKQSLIEAFEQYKDEMIPVLLSHEAIEQRESLTVQKSQGIAVAKRAIEILKSFRTTKGVKMNEDMKSVLGEVIASLQMLLQSGEQTAEQTEAAMKKGSEAIEKAKTLLKKAENDGNPKDVPDETKTQVNELMKSVEALKKAVALRKAEGEGDEAKKAEDEMKAALKALVKEEAPEENATEAVEKALVKMRKAETEEEKSAAEEEVKKALKRMAKAEDGNASEDAETIITDVLPNGDETAQQIAKAASGANSTIALAKMVTILAKELAVQKSALSQIVQGFQTPVQKGLNSNLGQDAMLEKLTKSLTERAAPAKTATYFDQFEGASAIQKSKDVVADEWRQMRQSLGR